MRMLPNESCSKSFIHVYTRLHRSNNGNQANVTSLKSSLHRNFAFLCHSLIVCQTYSNENYVSEVRREFLDEKIVLQGKIQRISQNFHFWSKQSYAKLLQTATTGIRIQNENSHFFVGSQKCRKRRNFLTDSVERWPKNFWESSDFHGPGRYPVRNSRARRH